MIRHADTPISAIRSDHEYPVDICSCLDCRQDALLEQLLCEQTFPEFAERARASLEPENDADIRH